ncbi:MAG: hypothetical protein HC896_11950 [Bacteroidales bacterium]|nr:hypothetical protein [Bacteroidales bacterium]
MKRVSLYLFMATAFFAFSFFSCEENSSATKTGPLDQFCFNVPKNWNCEIIRENFDSTDMPRNAAMPVAIVKYFNGDTVLQGSPIRLSTPR